MRNPPRSSNCSEVQNGTLKKYQKTWGILEDVGLKHGQIHWAQACWLKHWDSDGFLESGRSGRCHAISSVEAISSEKLMSNDTSGCRFAKNLREHRRQLNLGESEIMTNLMNTTCFDHWLDTSIASRLPPSGIPLDVRSHSVCGWSCCSTHEMLKNQQGFSLIVCYTHLQEPKIDLQRVWSCFIFAFLRKHQKLVHVILTYNWLVVWNMFYVPFYIWKFHHPNWRTHIFQRGWSTTNQIIINHH